MKNLLRCISVGIIAGMLFSCTVSNNLYVNNPVPTGKGNIQLYLGGGTGQKPEIDSTSDDGTIYSSGNISTAPILAIGGQYGINNQLDMRFAIHLPYVVGGFGLRAGAQYCFFNAGSRFNAAIGTDLGFVIAKDSLKVFGAKEPMNPEVKGAVNADFFMPFSVRVSDHFNIILTPRYSLNTFYIRKNENKGNSRAYNASIPVLSLGIKIYKWYIEATGLYYNEILYPNVGVAYHFTLDVVESNTIPLQE
jgi:hypothetical protein